ncbi:hypothetical protein SBV42_02715 [Chlamydia crocodili]|uniref:Uncharacterized protein n=1 Tax=Chlamydia crocodili TaxID=2766982 RepID=A0ABX8CFE6_9CHLA|nr:hypothetical protein [Chlamydia crocodili]QVE48686.1 hypothetical protein H9Q19_03095 [Chlamydia crocodili]
MLIRLFFGIPLTKGLQVINQPPLTVAIFQRKEYLGIYSPSGTALQITKLNMYYREAQEIIEKAVQGKYLTSKDSPLIVFPEILIGK